MSRYSLGIDFGTESARALLVDVHSGEPIATAIHLYADGVIDERLPGSEQPLPQDWALQNPADWLSAIEATVRAVLAESQLEPETVVGLGLDFTACTILPTTIEGVPLCTLEAYHDSPHAWPKLWKHHAAQPQADRINKIASNRGERWLARYGGKISSEWLIPKALQMLEEDSQVYAASGRIIEAGDWVAWQLTGELCRNACAAGYKANWHKGDGFPSSGLLAALHPDLVDLYQEKLSGPVVAPGLNLSGLTDGWARRLGLIAGTPVAVPIIDAHAAFLGGGVSEPGTMFMMMGTSTCHLLLGDREVHVEGIAGVVEDGIVPGYFGYEAGQAGAGDIFAWFVENAVPPAYPQAAEARGVTLHEVLVERGSALRPGQSGLLALDWWNGNRSTLVDADLSGMMLGLTSATTAEEIYRALIEATAFGTRVIIEAFTDRGLAVDSIVTAGGLTKNELLMQIYADVTGREMTVAAAKEASAAGAAMLGAVAAGKAAGGYGSLREATQQMTARPSRVYRPMAEHRSTYDRLYDEYRRLYDFFGRGESDVMKVLRQLR